MNTSFVNRKDRIIASAIDIISESGIASLTTKMLAQKENMSESLLYRYFGGIDEVLVEVVAEFRKFDTGIIATIEAKDMLHVDKALEFFRTLANNYEGYYELSSIVLNYEYLLHNVNTREAVAACIDMRTNFVRKELNLAVEEGEINDTLTPEELSILLFGGMTRDLLNRRIWNDDKTHLQVSQFTLDKLVDMVRIKGDS
ncbi:MAG: TetR/AcrR family transcriptional regulator [Clostridium sp.]|nr:TetR/AcrR family transcriptional regulator [Clostridium sp.]